MAILNTIETRSPIAVRIDFMSYGLIDIFSPQQISDPWPPLPATDGATVTATSHPHWLHVYFSPCFICICDLLYHDR